MFYFLGLPASTLIQIYILPFLIEFVEVSYVTNFLKG